MEVWDEPETPLEWIPLTRKERTDLFFKRLRTRVRKIFQGFASIFGIFTILFIVVQIGIGPRPEIFDKTKSSLQIELDRLYEMKRNG